jgi:ABC-type uncharacterized transport system fused permease/ATPase subunit
MNIWKTLDKGHHAPSPISNKSFLNKEYFMNNTLHMREIVSHLQAANISTFSNNNWEDWELESLRNRLQNFANSIDHVLTTRNEKASQDAENDDMGRDL